MLPEIEHLLVIQDRDRKIREIDQELVNIPKKEEEIRNRLEDDQATLDGIKVELTQNEIAMKNLELDIQTRRDSIGKLKVQQYETKKNEEFRKMGGEIERYEAEIIATEDRELELMELAEEIKVRMKSAAEDRDDSQTMVDEDIANLKIAMENMKKERVEFVTNRSGYLEKVDEDLLDTYGRLFKAKDGWAVVGLIDGACQGCHMRVTKSTELDVRNENVVTHCQNCGRILYWWTDEADKVVDRYK
ncbi:MAG: zinc ribbon domain-containing protein [Verrucomicrobiales bacterium]